MSSALLESSPRSEEEKYFPRLLTCADLEALPEELPSGTVRYELHDGVLVIMAPPGGIHSLATVRFVKYFLIHGEDKGLGRTYVEITLLLRRNPDHVLVPDVAFLSKDKFPPVMSPQGYLETIPELIVEVRSPSNTLAELARKAADYLQAGALVVWVADPVAERILVYRSGQPVRIVAKDEILDVPEVIHGFAVRVKELLGLA